MADKRTFISLKQKIKDEEDDINIGRQRSTVKKCGKMVKTYNSRYLLVVTHPTTNLPI
jgi:hypothetical protein